MNVNMWNHPATQKNLEILRARGVKIVEPGAGYLACGMTGAGRLAENEIIVAAVLEALGASQDLAGETVLVTAGPTREKIDPRAISPIAQVDAWAMRWLKRRCAAALACC